MDHSYIYLVQFIWNDQHNKLSDYFFDKLHKFSYILLSIIDSNMYENLCKYI